jgi:polyphosphate kinase 2 (PPK2 family)
VPIELTEFERGEPFIGDAEAAIASLQHRLAHLQTSQIVHRKRAIILFEGWIASGKRAALRRLAGSWDPTHFQVHSVGGADEADDDRHWLAPFWSRLPAAGDTTIFFRSWYRRIIEQRVSGKASDKAWARACDEVNEFEAQQRDHGTLVVKLYFHVSAERQLERLNERREDPWEQHLLTQEDVSGLGQRDRIAEVVHETFRNTHTRWAPWHVIDGNDLTSGTISALTAIADLYEKAMPAAPPEVGEKVIQFRQTKANENSRA